MYKLNNAPYSLGEGHLIKVLENSLFVRFDNEKYGCKTIPKSQIHIDSEVFYVNKLKQGSYGNVIVKNWFATKADWI